MVVSTGSGGVSREPGRSPCTNEFGWLGFGPLSANVLAHPAPDLADLDIAIKRVDIATTVTELMAVTNDKALPPTARAELAYEQFGLALATAKIRREIDVAYWFARCCIRQNGDS